MAPTVNERFNNLQGQIITLTNRLAELEEFHSGTRNIHHRLRDLEDDVGNLADRLSELGDRTAHAATSSQMQINRLAKLVSRFETGTHDVGPQASATRQSAP
ncbi:MAG: hypothetical protein Q9163_001750 [Psora crenata]